MGLVLALGFVNLCVNPIIYAARYEVFRKSLRKMRKRELSNLKHYHTVD